MDRTPAKKGKDYRQKHKPGNPGRGGVQPGSGSKGGLKQAMDALHRLDELKFRLPEGASDAEVKLASQARQAIIEVMLRPTRHAGHKLSAAVRILDEMCGKIEDKLKIDEHKVTVEVRQTPPAPKPAIEASPATPALPEPEKAS